MYYTDITRKQIWYNYRSTVITRKTIICYILRIHDYTRSSHRSCPYTIEATGLISWLLSSLYHELGSYIWTGIINHLVLQISFVIRIKQWLDVVHYNQNYVGLIAMWFFNGYSKLKVVSLHVILPCFLFKTSTSVSAVQVSWVRINMDWQIPLC